MTAAPPQVPAEAPPPPEDWRAAPCPCPYPSRAGLEEAMEAAGNDTERTSR